MHINFFSALDKLLYILSSSEKLSTQNNKLVTVLDNQVLTPIGDVCPLLFRYRSKLPDQLINFQLLLKFIENLARNNEIVRLNHIGFCYKVDSQQGEKERLIGLIGNTDMHLYVEPSNDDGMWFFIGNADGWEDMMIELIPVENTKDTSRDYWLPHVHFDIDTTLTEREIKKSVKSAFGDSIHPFSLAIDDVVYIVRCRLGTVNGVNITLDLATNSRNVKYHRLHLLKRIDSF